MKIKGFTLIESLFSFSIYILCIITFISLYTLGRKQMIKTNNEYEMYLTNQINKEKDLCIENGIENILMDLQ